MNVLNEVTMKRVTCNDIDWYKVSCRCRENSRVGDTGLKMLDLICDIINNYEDTAWAWKRDVDWSSSDDVMALLQWHTRMGDGVFKTAKERFDVISFLSYTIPSCQLDDAAIKRELKRRETNPYPGCYGYTYVYGRNY